MQQKRPDRPDASAGAGMLGAGLTMVAAVALFALGGKWLDDTLGWSSPLFLLLGFFLGALGGFIHLVNAVAPELLPFHKKPTAPPGSGGGPAHRPEDDARRPPDGADRPD